MLLDAITSLVRHFGPFRAALVVTLTCVVISGLVTALTMAMLEANLFPALYLATLIPLGLALPVTYLTHLTVQRADRAQQVILKSEQDARAAQTVLRDAIEGFPGGFTLFDRDDRLLLCNQRHREFYPEISELLIPGVSFAELARAVAERNVVRGTGPPDAYVEKRLHERRRQALPLEQQMADGRWILVSEQETKNGQTVVVRTDITQFKRTSEALRESEERFFQVFQSSPVMICIIDAQNHRFSDVNETWLNVFGFERDEVIGHRSAETGLWTDPHQHQILLDTLRDEGRVSGFVQQSRTPNG
jgi:PAS domain-containing protein